MKTIKLSLLACAVLIIGFISCKKDNPLTPPTSSITKVDSIQAAFSATGPFTFFSFKDDKLIAASDSNSTKWDFAFRFVEIRVNSYSSGPGSVGVIRQKGIFDDLKIAPESGYSYDTSRNQLAINSKDRDPNAWYLYDPTVHALTPKAGQFFIFRTSENKYVKMEILSVTTDVPFTNPVPPTKIWYKFRYTYQSDGSRNF
ncbi:MAG: HmuY family protein [Ginsengibacter sp.]